MREVHVKIRWKLHVSLGTNSSYEPGYNVISDRLPSATSSPGL